MRLYHPALAVAPTGLPAINQFLRLPYSCIILEALGTGRQIKCLPDEMLATASRQFAPFQEATKREIQ